METTCERCGSLRIEKDNTRTIINPNKNACHSCRKWVEEQYE